MTTIISPAHAVECPVCGAQIGQRCHVPSGAKRDEPHNARLQLALKKLVGPKPKLGLDNTVVPW